MVYVDRECFGKTTIKTNIKFVSKLAFDRFNVLSEYKYFIENLFEKECLVSIIETSDNIFDAAFKMNEINASLYELLKITNENVNEIEQIEDDIYNTLSDEQRAIKEKELKNNFSKLYNDSNDYIEKINNKPKSEDNIEILEKLVNSLVSIKNYVSDYIINTYSTKSYTENDIMYQKFLVGLVAIKNILAEMAKEKA
jgi:hypothetical protein